MVVETLGNIAWKAVAPDTGTGAVFAAENKSVSGNAELRAFYCTYCE